MLKEKTISLDDRVNTYTFIIREMPVRQRFRWKAKFLLMLASGGITLPEGGDLKEFARGDSGLQTIKNLLSGVNYDEALPLIEELLNCCSRVIGDLKEKVSFDTVDGYLEDEMTLFKLIQESFLLNNSFFVNAAPSTSQDGASTGRPATTSEAQPIIQTFPSK